MTDLITRLRTLSRPGGGGSIGNEAADEIERLQDNIDCMREEIEKLQNTLKNMPPKCPDNPLDQP